MSSRAKHVRALASKVQAHQEALATQSSLEMGKPLKQSRAEVEKCVRALESIADIAVQNLKPRQVQAHYKTTLVQPDPLGVVFSIQPWNFPYWQALRMSACAWMAGNVVLLKHSNSVAGCAELLDKILHDHEMPLLLNSRMNHDQASRVITSPLVQAVTFTGSTKGGRSIAKTAGESLKKCILELGGNDAYIIMADCDLPAAVKACVETRLINAGQSCVAGKRFFVEDKIYDQFKEAFIEELRCRESGNPLDENTQIGPLAAAKFVDEIEKQIELAKSQGAEFHQTFSRLGNFSSRGVLEFKDNLSGFEAEEVFGPVALLYRFMDLTILIEKLNKGPFGLGSGVFTKNEKIVQILQQDLRVGTLSVNDFVKSDPRVPFGGVRDSGFNREMGLEGLHDFVSWKVVGKA